MADGSETRLQPGMLLQRTSPMPCCSARCLQNSALLQYIHKGITGFIDSRAGCCGRLPARALFRRSPAASAGARPRCWRPPAMLAPPQPTDADGTRRSAQGSPKHASSSTAKTEAVEDLEARSPKFPRNLNRSPKCFKDQSKPEARIEARNARRSRKRSSK